jgi:integrase
VVGSVPMDNALSRGATDWREGRRLRAFKLKQRGWSQQRIAEALGVSKGAVCQWMKQARDGGGARALKRQPTPGARPRQHQVGEIYGACGLWRENGLIFASESGSPLSHQHVTARRFKPLLKQAGLPKIRFHDLRHTCATLLLSKNVNPKVVRHLLPRATYHAGERRQGDGRGAFLACWRRKRPGGLNLLSSLALRKDSGPGTISMAVALFVR